MSSQLQVAIANHLNLSPNQISRVEEWATVYFAVVVGKGGRFVSKKIEVKMERKDCCPGEYAELVAAELNRRIADAPYKNFKAKVWYKKSDETRVYLGDYGYYGIYHEPDSEGSAQVIYKVKSYMKDFVRDCVAAVRAENKLAVTSATLISKDSLTAKLCRNCLVNDAMDGIDLCCDCVD